MNPRQDRIVERAAELRQAFDRSFADPPRAERAELADFLTVRVADDDYAIPLADVAGLYVDKKITPLPSGVAELLGIAGLRGVILPVYDLRPLLGYPGGAAPRWLVLTRQAALGFAFDAFDGHVRLAREAVLEDERPEGRRRHVRGMLQAPDGVRPIVYMSALIELARERADRAHARKERVDR